MEEIETPPNVVEKSPEDKEMPDIGGKSFQEFETELTEYLSELTERVPEAFRGLIPRDMALIQQVRWVRDALRWGLFASQKPEADGPGAYRPTTKKTADLSGMTPHQLMSMGYGQK